MRYQSGSLRKKRRKSGEDVWEFRYRDAQQIMRQKTFKVLEFPTPASVKIELQKLVFSLNDPATMTKTTPFGMVMERFIVEERLREIVAQPRGVVTEKGLAYSTARSYLSMITTHLLPKWAEVPIESIRPFDVLAWLKVLPVGSGLTKGKVKGLMHNLFERAMLWELLAIQRNPIDLVRLKGVGTRKKKKIVLTIEQFQDLREMLGEPYKGMVTFAVCTGLRISEILALRWEHIRDGSLLVQAACIEGRIGRVKTQASSDDIPLNFGALEGLTPKTEGLVFQSETGEPLDGGNIQQDILRVAGIKLNFGDGLGWHTFRHTYRTLLDSVGTPVGVQQKLMRHANVSTTMNVYGSSSMGDKRDANSKVVQMVIGRTA